MAECTHRGIKVVISDICHLLWCQPSVKRILAVDTDKGTVYCLVQHALSVPRAHACAHSMRCCKCLDEISCVVAAYLKKHDHTLVMQPLHDIVTDLHVSGMHAK